MFWPKYAGPPPLPILVAPQRRFRAKEFARRKNFAKRVGLGKSGDFLRKETPRLAFHRNSHNLK